MGRDRQQPDRSLIVTGQAGERTLPSEYVAQHVELAYATTAYGAQGETVETAHLLLGEMTSAASAYVGMTRRSAILPTSSPTPSTTHALNGSRPSAATAQTSEQRTPPCEPTILTATQPARSHSVAMQVAVLRVARERAAGADHAPGRSRFTFRGFGR